MAGIACDVGGMQALRSAYLRSTCCDLRLARARQGTPGTPLPLSVLRPGLDDHLGSSTGQCS
jgi:hypothetical protein